MLLKVFQSLLTSPEFVQNLKASSSLIMGCPLAKETALSCIQIRYKRMHRWTKRKTIPTSTLKTDTKLLAMINIQYQLIQNSLDWISDFRMTSWHVHARATFLVNLNISYPKLSGRDFAPQSLYNLSGNKYIEIAFYVSVKFCTLWVQRERVGGGGGGQYQVTF